MRERKTKQQAAAAEPGPGPKEYDYSHFRGVTASDDKRIDREQIEHAIEFVEGYGQEEPFCLYLALSLPHPPYGVTQEWYDRIDGEKVPAPVRLTEEEWAKKPAILRGIRGNQKLYEWSDERLKEMKRVYYAMGTGWTPMSAGCWMPLRRKAFMTTRLSFSSAIMGTIRAIMKSPRKTKIRLRIC